MKYHKISITFLVTSVIFILISFIVLLPAIPRAESWSGLYLFIFLCVFLLGVLDIIFGLLNLIKKKAYNLLSIYFGAINLIMGFFFIFLFSYYGVLLFIPGIIILYLGFKEED